MVGPHAPPTTTTLPPPRRSGPDRDVSTLRHRLGWSTDRHWSAAGDRRSSNRRGRCRRTYSMRTGPRSRSMSSTRGATGVWMLRGPCVEIHEIPLGGSSTGSFAEPQALGGVSGRKDAFGIDEIRADQRADHPNPPALQVDRGTVEFEQIATAQVPSQMQTAAIAQECAGLVDPRADRRQVHAPSPSAAVGRRGGLASRGDRKTRTMPRLDASVHRDRPTACIHEPDRTDSPRTCFHAENPSPRRMAASTCPKRDGARPVAA